MAQSTYNVIGVMSGTSLDGIDIIYVTFFFDKQWVFKIREVKTIKYSTKWKTLLSKLVNNSIDELREIDEKYSNYLAFVISDFVQKNNIKSIDFIASHGHTALHQPQKGLTYQIGNQPILADILKQKVICDFRIQDVEFGGQGAPLVPIGDRLLFKNYKYCLNLGGFANISFEHRNNRVAYDICPVNIVLNHYISKLGFEYDDKGLLAASGNLVEELLIKLNKLKYYSTPPPKSLGLEWVKLHIIPLIDSFNLQVEDILRTFVEHVAIQISQNLKFKDATVLITGGGVYNEYLIERFKSHSTITIIIPENEIVEFKEALIFGFLGVLKERDEVNCLKSVTGASRDHSSGNILIPNI